MFGIRTKTSSIIKHVKILSETAQQKTNSFIVKFDEKTKGTILESWAKFWKNVYKDYADVFVDVGQNMKEKPAKAVLLFSGFAFTVYCFKQNPNETHYRNALLKASNEVLLVHPKLQRSETVNHLRQIEQSYNTNVIRYMNLRIFSLMWIDNYSSTCGMYETQCSYLQLQYSKFVDRIVDVGFLDTWWILAKKMTDYDINY